MLHSAYDITNSDEGLREIFEAEGFAKERLLTDLKEFYWSLFEKDLLEEEVFYFHNSNPLKDHVNQTEDLALQGKRSLSYDLTTCSAKLTTDFKDQLNLEVRTYDVTLLEDLTRLSYTQAYKLSLDIEQAKDFRVSFFHSNLEYNAYYFTLSDLNSVDEKRVFAIDLNDFQNFISFIKSFGNQNLGKLTLQHAVARSGFLRLVLGKTQSSTFATLNELIEFKEKVHHIENTTDLRSLESLIIHQLDNEVT